VKFAAVVLIACVFSKPVKAQAGRAPNGYYPAGYSGRHLYRSSGESRRAPETSELGLYEGKQNRTIRGQPGGRLRLEEQRRRYAYFHAAPSPERYSLDCFYMGSAKESNGDKTTQHWVIAISLAEINGKKIPEDQRAVISCSAVPLADFKAFH
jgi:hypothetical protein